MTLLQGTKAFHAKQTHPNFAHKLGRQLFGNIIFVRESGDVESCGSMLSMLRHLGEGRLRFKLAFVNWFCHLHHGSSTHFDSGIVPFAIRDSVPLTRKSLRVLSAMAETNGNLCFHFCCKGVSRLEITVQLQFHYK